ncbi:MAG: nuclear transport factor 2 family protein [Blastocatellia bacterium]
MKDESPRQMLGRMFDSPLVAALCWLALTAAVSFALLSRTGAAMMSGKNEQAVRDFVTAFNRHDTTAMAALVAGDIQWMNVKGSAVEVEVAGRAALEQSMAAYFRSCPTCHSEIESIMTAGRFVTIHERAMWTGKNGAQAQRSLGVYEIRDGRIQRAWYYPAEK